MGFHLEGKLWQQQRKPLMLQRLGATKLGSSLLPSLKRSRKKSGDLENEK